MDAKPTRRDFEAEAIEAGRPERVEREISLILLAKWLSRIE